MKHSTYSVIIVGSGIAGLYAAIKLSETMHLPDGILLLTKSQLAECNSRYAQGGIVGVLPENKADSISLHIADTIKAGCGLCDFNVVKFISENSNRAIKDLIKYGVEFDRNDKKQLNFTLEGAHSVRRILHVGGDATGYGIEKALVNKVKNDPAIASNITIYEQTLAIDLLVDSKNNCRGVISFNDLTKEYETVYAPITILATGGTGQVYKYTTNPSVTTGDGLALGIRANAKIKDMEFIQFHPTALSLENNDSRFLISESVRGEGAKLVNQKGEYFMENHPQKDLAPRDVVAREIYSQLSKGNKVFLDATFIDIDKFKTRFPNIYKSCMDNNIDVTKDFIPVSPAAHYCMGGIKTEINGKTSVNNLYAIGEVACTSLHGANRLASNSLLECVVSAFELVNTINKQTLTPSNIIDESVLTTIKKYSPENDMDDMDFDCKKLSSELRDLMWNKVGIVRTEASLLDALSELNKIEQQEIFKDKCNSIEEYELRNMLYVAKCIINSALKRKESIGAHYRADSETKDIKHDMHTEDKSDESKITA
ncbi:MAG TPA: L-aspartate oxidase [Candidatus Limenecus avicola]|uniref:L-aspartate oxidase n=1 Tax=Candidatus Limenecus avicola TaxID=2840847 RepID=A0A9D1N0X7_9CLOT|nr:L-aspartate oxidase [Candidatus Limenecus avicola]